jgi:lysophospholipase L1-like esterase
VEIGKPKRGADARRRALYGAALVVLGLIGLELFLRGLEARSAPLAGPHGILGYRGPRFSSTRDERGVRVLVVGDEVAYGPSLPEEHTWPRQLESLFGRDGMASRVELVNASEEHADLERVLAQARGALFELQPTWVVVCVGASDAAAALAASAPERRAPLALLRRLGSDAAPPASREVARQELSDLSRKTAFDFGVRLAQLIEAARGKHARVLVVLAPREWPDSEQERASAVQRGVVPAGQATAELQRALHEEARRVAQATGVRLLDASAQLSASSGAFGADGRLNAQGALALARLVHEDLRRARI